MTDDRLLASSDGTKIAATIAGSGPPLVLVHGSLGSKGSWGLVAPLLAEHHTVWTFDRRGRGDSGDAADHSLDKEVEDLAVVLAAAGPRAHLVGHSFGAVCSLEAAARGADIASLLLYEPPVRPLAPDVVDHVRTSVESGDVDGAIRTFLPAAGASPDELAALAAMPPVWERLLDGGRRLPRELDAASALGWQPERYRSITVPTVLLAGALTASAVYLTIDELRTAVSHARVATLEGQRHLAIAFDPESFAGTVLGVTAPEG